MDYNGWEIIEPGEPLGEGGQGTVYRVRSPTRATERCNALKQISDKWVCAAMSERDRTERVRDVANAVFAYTRPQTSAELGALKVFKFSEAAAEADEQRGRLRNEIAALRELDGRGALKLLDSDEQRWIITEFCPFGTLEDKPGLCRGDVRRALEAFRPLVNTVACLHSKSHVHRDIKPGNIFLAADGGLLLGDFGIIFVPGETRLTKPRERVGPRDCMAPWANIGKRLDEVDASQDVFMLGKLLWFMVAGNGSILPFWFHPYPEYDLEKLFPDDTTMSIVNSILRQCVVEKREDCLSTATELLTEVDNYLNILRRHGQLFGKEVTRTCRVCGQGSYLPPNKKEFGALIYTNSAGANLGTPIKNYVMVCDKCGHVDLFEAQKAAASGLF
jgi:serine/threonine protein kinase